MALLSDAFVIAIFACPVLLGAVIVLLARIARQLDIIRQDTARVVVIVESIEVFRRI